jgi:hypothetical protein
VRHQQAAGLCLVGGSGGPRHIRRHRGGPTCHSGMEFLKNLEILLSTDIQYEHFRFRKSEARKVLRMKKPGPSIPERKSHGYQFITPNIEKERMVRGGRLWPLKSQGEPQGNGTGK